MMQRDAAAHVQARVATMGRGSTDELLHVQIADDRRVHECPRGVRVRGEGTGALGRKEVARTRMKQPDPMSNREPGVDARTWRRVKVRAFVCVISGASLTD